MDSILHIVYRIGLPAICLSPQTCSAKPHLAAVAAHHSGSSSTIA
jgi:hypothetical protein